MPARRRRRAAAGAARRARRGARHRSRPTARSCTPTRRRSSSTGDRVRLPVDIDAWSDAAGLTDLGGQPDERDQLAAVAGGRRDAGGGRAGGGARRGPARLDSLTPSQRDAARGPAAVGHRLRPVRDRRRHGLDDGVRLVRAGAGGVPAALRHRARRPAAAGGAARPRRGGHRHVVHHHRPAAPGRPAGLGEPVVHPAHRLHARRGRRAATAGSCRAPTPTAAAVGPDRARRCAAGSRSPRCCSTTAATAPPSGTRCRSPRCSTATASWSTSSACRTTSPSG